MSHALAIALIALCPGVDADFVSLSTALEFHYTGGGYQNELFRYRLFEPAVASTQERWPLIVWLHGNCESERDNIAHLKWLDQFVFRPPWDKGRYPFYLLAVQCPRDNFNWTKKLSDAQDDMVNVAAAILEQTLRDYPIDDERVYAAGVSSGGDGAWELAIRSPRRFAAVVPLGSGGGDNARVQQIQDIPVWTFHCNRDTATPVELVRTTTQILKARGGNVCLTEVDSERHDCWTVAFNQYHLLEWMLSQRAGHKCPAPGTVPFATRFRDFMAGWQWWQVLVQAGIPLFFLAVVVHARRLRRRSNATMPTRRSAVPK